MTTDDKSEDKTGPAGPLTRHVFLDAEAYHRFNYNLNSAPLRALGSRIAEGRLLLHVTDITLSEIERHIYEEATKIAHSAKQSAKDLKEWRSRAPSMELDIPEAIDPTKLGQAAFAKFNDTMRWEWRAHQHNASGASAALIFKLYFQRRAPFDTPKSKEFPDAFALWSLAEWCRSTGSTMYVVSADGAVQRAAKETGVLLPVKDLQDLLERVTFAETPEIVERVEHIVESTKFLDQLEEQLHDKVPWLGTVYTGDLPDGDVHEIEVIGTPKIERISVLSSSPKSIAVLLAARVPVRVGFSYEDRTHASYDREDDVYIGATNEESDFEDAPLIRMVVEIDPSDSSIRDIDFVTRDVQVSEPNENYK
jgi:hypothetical protein